MDRAYAFALSLLLLASCAQSAEMPEAEEAMPAPQEREPRSTCDAFLLNVFPLAPEQIETIIPMGRVQDSHVTPTDHQYVIPMGTKGGSLVTDEPGRYQVISPADGAIVHLEIFKEPVEESYRSQPYSDNYLVEIEHGCGVSTRMIHLDTVRKDIMDKMQWMEWESQHPYARGRVPVEEGETIGTVGPHSFDFMVVDTRVTLPGFIVPSRYSGNSEPWKTHVVDTFDYLAEPMRSALLAKSLKRTEPYGGKLDYDVDGTLLGNWYRRGAGEQWEYWKDELSVVYDHLDTTQIRISLGDYDGYPKVFAVHGNAPDPASVGVGETIAYELQPFEYYVGEQRWDGIHHAEGIVARNLGESRGFVLFEMSDSRTLTVETFPRAASAPLAFTSAAQVYER